MKIIKIYILILALFWLPINSQWLADDNFQQTDDLEFPIHIQFYNQITGWIVRTNTHDTIYKTTNAGINWTGISTGDTNGASGLFFLDLNTGWVVGGRGKIVKTTNGGLSWFSQNSGVSSWLNSVYFVDVNMGIAVGSKDSNRVLLKTTNGGGNWQVLIRNSQSRLYSVFMTGPQSIYCVGDSGAVIYSSNGGTSWINHISGTTSTLRDVIFKNYGPFSIGWVAGKNGVILSTSNGGTNWINRSFNTVNFYGIDFGSYDSGYVCGRGRIYKTVNGGLNWFQQTTPVPDSVNIKDVFCINSQIVWAAPFTGNLIYSTNGGGPIGIEPISNEVPLGFSLAQNFPNPFNPNTKIQFSIPKSSFSKLTIFDVTGRVMAILVDEELKPGTYQVDWDASHRASGIYYYKLEADGFAETKKMVVLK